MRFSWLEVVTNEMYNWTIAVQAPSCETRVVVVVVVVLVVVVVVVIIAVVDSVQRQ